MFSAFDKTKGTPVSVRQWVYDFTKYKVAKDDNLAKCRKLVNYLNYYILAISVDGNLFPKHLFFGCIYAYVKPFCGITLN